MTQQMNSMKIELNAQKLKNDEQMRQMAQLRAELEDKKNAIERLTTDNEKLHQQNQHDQQRASVAASLQLSNSSNNTREQKKGHHSGNQSLAGPGQ